MIYIANFAGETASGGGDHTRHSGVSLLDAPPPRNPYVAMPADPMVLWERLPDDFDPDDDGVVGDQP